MEEANAGSTFEFYSGKGNSFALIDTNQRLSTSRRSELVEKDPTHTHSPEVTLVVEFPEELEDTTTKNGKV